MSQDFLDLMSSRRIDSVRVGSEVRNGDYRIIPTANHWGLWRGDVFIGEILQSSMAVQIAKLLNDNARPTR